MQAAQLRSPTARSRADCEYSLAGGRRAVHAPAAVGPRLHPVRVPLDELPAHAYAHARTHARTHGRTRSASCAQADPSFARVCVCAMPMVARCSARSATTDKHCTAVLWLLLLQARWPCRMRSAYGTPTSQTVPGCTLCVPSPSSAAGRIGVSSEPHGTLQCRRRCRRSHSSVPRRTSHPARCALHVVANRTRATRCRPSTRTCARRFCTASAPR